MTSGCDGSGHEFVCGEGDGGGGDGNGSKTSILLGPVLKNIIPVAVLFIVWLIVLAVLMAFQFRLKKWGAPTWGSLNTWTQADAARSFLCTQHKWLQISLIVYFVTMWALALAALASDGYTIFASGGSALTAGAFVFHLTGTSSTSTWTDLCGDSTLPLIYPADMSDYSSGGDYDTIQSTIQKIHKAECTVASVASYITWIELMCVLGALSMVWYYSAVTIRAWYSARDAVVAAHNAAYPNVNSRPPCVMPVFQVVSLQTLRWSSIACVLSFCSTLMYATVTFLFLTHLSYSSISAILWTSWRLDIVIFIFLVVSCWYQRVQIRHTSQPAFQPPMCNPGSVVVPALVPSSPAYIQQLIGAAGVKVPQQPQVMMMPLGQQEGVAMPPQYSMQPPQYQMQPQQLQPVPQYAVQQQQYQQVPVQAGRTVMASPFGPQYQQQPAMHQPQQVYYSAQEQQQPGMQQAYLPQQPSMGQIAPQPVYQHQVVPLSHETGESTLSPASPSAAMAGTVVPPAFCGNCGASFAGIMVGVRFCPACGNKI